MVYRQGRDRRELSANGRWRSTPFFRSTADPSYFNEQRPTRLRVDRAWRNQIVISGSSTLHGFKNCIIGYLAVTDVQPVGKMRIAIQRRHPMVGKRQNMRQCRVVQRL